MAVLKRGSDYGLQEIALYPNYGSGTKVDLSAMMVEMHIFEDIHKPFLHGTIMISDSVGLIEQMPIVGEEFLDIVIETPGADQTIEHSFQVYEVGTKISAGNSSEVYTLKFMSKEAFKNATNPISIGFTGELISDQVKKIYNDHLKIDKKIDVEATKNPRQMSFSMWAPTRIILEMMKTAQSAKYSEGADYKFWEGLDGFHFRTVQSLLDEIEPKVDSKKREELKWIGQNLCGADNPATNNQAIRDYKILAQANNAKRMMDGTIGSTQINFDPIMGGVEIVDASMDDMFKKVQTMEPNKPLSSKFADIYKSSVANMQANLRMVFHDASEEFASGVEKFATTAEFQRRLTFNTKIDLELNGNTNRKIGDVVDLNIPATIGVDQGLLNDSQISGNALIVAINHTFQQNQYLQSVRVVKDSSREKIDSLVP